MQPHILPKHSSRMTRSQQPMFKKVTTRRMEIVQACEKIANLMQYHIRFGLARIQAVSLHSISQSMMSQSLSTNPNRTNNVSKDLVKRHQKAE
jgi:hypothetical protein